MTLRALILGAAAGGGLPQWNCNGPNSRMYWRGSAAPMAAASQSSIAVSVDGSNWAILNASPDIRSQIMATPAVQPRGRDEHGLRDSPINAVLLTNGDIDHIAGLLTLREGHAFNLHATQAILDVLAANPIFDALRTELVPRNTVGLDAPFELLPGLSAELFAVPGKVPLFMEGDEASVKTDLMGEQTIGVRLSDSTSSFYYVPGCARVTEGLASRLSGADTLLFDGTVYHDDEMIREGVGIKTGQRMGHISMEGPDGSLAAFANLNIRRKIYVHINNTNPVWRPDSAERRVVEQAGWEIGYDGMEIEL